MWFSRKAGGQALREADELLLANKFEAAREKIAAAKAAFTKGRKDDEQDSAFKVIKELDQKLEASQWFKQSAPGNGGRSASPQRTLHRQVMIDAYEYQHQLPFTYNSSLIAHYCRCLGYVQPRTLPRGNDYVTMVLAPCVGVGFFK